MDLETAFRVLRVRMFEKGHSFKEIEEMNMDDFGDVIGYWTENSRADEKERKQREKLSKHRHT